MDRLAIQAEKRDELGSGPSGRLRKAGRLPCVVYGTGEPPLSVTVDRRDFEHMLRDHAGEHALVDLDVAGDKQTVLVQEIQHHPVRGEMVHVDFMRIRMGVKLQTALPLRITGTARGVKMDGGMLDQTIREIEVECLPSELPEDISIDVTDLGIGDVLTAGDIPIPSGVTILTPADRVVVHVLPPRVAEAEAEVAAEAGEIGETEPERIGETERAEEGAEETD